MMKYFGKLPKFFRKRTQSKQLKSPNTIKSSEKDHPKSPPKHHDHHSAYAEVLEEIKAQRRRVGF
tara:strand:+ start:947 stop:1141 length:195 start_codon:yes stop_codon:yes gene_type:complete